MKIPISRFRNIPRFAKRHNERYYQNIVHCSDGTKIHKKYVQFQESYCFRTTNTTCPIMEIEQYLSKLPEYDFAITYGSGVFKQIGYSEKDRKNAMLDVIIGVRDPTEWHRVNMQLNPEHYSFFRHLGSSTIEKLEVEGTKLI